MRLKKWCRRLFVLPLWLALLILAPSLALVAAVLARGGEPSALHYGAYFLSAYGTAVTVAAVVRALRRGPESLALVRKFRGTAAGARYWDDPVFRAEVSLYTGLGINLAYVAVKLISGIYYRSLWFAALSAYYLMLSLLRFALLHHVRRSPIGREYASELRRCRLCGVLLLVLNQALSAIVTLVVVRNQGFRYGGYLIYVMAMYAFYAVISSAVQAVRFRKYKSPVLSAAKAVNLTAALVSMLSLETAMLAQFGEDEGFRRLMTAATGFAVCAFVLGLAVYMIVRSSRALKEVTS